MDASTFDAHRTTFEVLDYSRPLSAAKLHFSYLPILSDRSVAKHTLEELVRDSLDFEAKSVLDSLGSSASLRKWLYDNNMQLETMPKKGSMPWSNLEKLDYLLETGFALKTSKFVSILVKRILENMAKCVSEKMSVRIGRSTTP